MSLAVALFGNKTHFLTKDKSGAEEKLSAVLKTGGIKLLYLVPINLSMEDVFVHRFFVLEKSRWKEAALL